jgi:hypothetical protein
MTTGTGMYNEEHLRRWIADGGRPGKQSISEGDPIKPYVSTVKVARS